MSVFGLIKSYEMIDNMRNMFEGSHNHSFSSPTTYSTSVDLLTNAWFSPSRVSKNENGYEVTVELPGLSRSDVNVGIQGKTLTISASREVKYGKNQTKEEYKNSWALPDHTSFESINAKYEAGVLTVDIPLKKEYTRKIEVE